MVRGRHLHHGGQMPVLLIGRGDSVGHGERRCELERRFPGWGIWYVPRQPGGATWRARPRLLINADDPEDLAAAIRAADNPVIPDSALPPSGRAYPARGPWPGRLEAPAGSAWRCVKAAERARRGARFPAGDSARRGLSTLVPRAAPGK
jgi:hypothetical protein